MFSVFKDIATGVAPEVVGCRVHKGRRKGNAWWTGERQRVTEGKRRAYKKHYKGIWQRKLQKGGISKGLGKGKYRSLSKKVWMKTLEGS